MHRAPVPSPDDEPFEDDVPQPVPQEEPVPDPNPEIPRTRR
jgi:hypothetical protein